MRCIVYFICGGLWLGCVSGVSAAGNRFALLVGVEKYQHSKLDDLQYCGDDVLALERLLTTQGFRCVALRNDSDPKSEKRPSNDSLPTAANINAELTKILRGITKDELVLVVLTGHGLQPEGEKQPYFCPLDANPSVDTDANGRQTLVRPETLVGIGTLLKRLDESGAGEKLVLVDACRNAPATKGLKGIKGGVDSVAFELLPEQCGVLLSCSRGQFSYENGKIGPSGRGAFLHHVIRGLEGEAADRDGEISWDSLVLYVKKSVPRTIVSLRSEVGEAARQVPEGINRLSGSPLLGRLTESTLPPPLFDATRGKTATDAKASQAAWAKHLKTNVEIENSLGMKLRLIPPGEYRRGSTPADIDAVVSLDATFKKEHGDDEQPQHTVRLTKPFRLGTTEVTRGQFRRFVNATGYVTEAEKDDGGWGWNEKDGKFEGRKKEYNWKNTGFIQSDDHPVVNVTWNDAKAFIEWLSREEKIEYRLPTEAEWEYACRAGTTTLYQSGNTFAGLEEISNVADAAAKAKWTNYSNFNYLAASDGHVFAAPAGRYKANGFGLSDMHGNVWEWCGDGYDAKEYAKHAGGIIEDPKGPSAEASDRVMRGGGWSGTPGFCRSAYRYWNTPVNRNLYLGFRVLAVQSFR